MQIYRGTWVDPERITAIVTSPKMGAAAKGQGEWWVTVLQVDYEVTGWEFDSREDADAWADKIARLIDPVVSA